jgi:hypothetical protein
MRPQQRRLHAPQLNLKFGGILMENKAFKEDGPRCHLPIAGQGLFLRQSVRIISAGRVERGNTVALARA